MKAFGRAPASHQSMVLTRVRGHAQICMNIDDEHCLGEALQMNLEGVREAKSSESGT